MTPPFIQRDEQIQCIVLWKQAPDISDVRSETNAYRMVLLEDGSGVEVYEPSLPKFMMVDDPSDFYGDMGPAMGNACYTAHLLATTAIDDDVNLQTRKYILKFPHGMVGEMGHHINPDTGRELIGGASIKNSFVNKKSNGELVPFSHVTDRFIVVLTNNEKKTLKPKKKNFTNVDDLLEGMNSFRL